MITPGQQAVLRVVMAQLGKPYQWDGKGPDTFDCSGLVSWGWLYGVGVVIPPGTHGELTFGTEVGGTNVPFPSIQSLLQPCDLIFPTTEHVQIWDGSMIIEAPYTGAFVRRVPEWAVPPYQATIYQVRRMPFSVAPTVPKWPGRYLQLLTPHATGSDVLTWQRQLNTHSAVTPKIATDGDFGPGTAAATRQFQASAKLTVDGVVGPITWAAAWS